jgi:D-threo-aldose 1-dehydrogenase
MSATEIDSTIVGVSSPGRRAQLDALAATVIPDSLWGDIDSPIDDSAYL